ncbi:RNA-binding transcriptional accessory protein [Candidatus Gracilibacteria bacterium]|nr:MAG: RNA-binding transcriptional accessory protein [Candidatus Gracilibacteria bacterium]
MENIKNKFNIQEPKYFEEIALELDLKENQISSVLELVGEGATVPFIARYRKEKTENLDEDQIREIIKTKTRIENLYEAKKTAINGIIELDKMTDELFENILKAKTLKEVEDIYKPYKSKKKTKAMIAIENGFQIVADEIKKNKNISENDEILKNFENFSFEEIIEGSLEIIAAEISANSDLRADLIETLQKFGEISSKYKTEKSLEKLNEKDKEQIPKFEIYKEFITKISYLKPYQILALNRGEKLGILNIKIEKTDKTFEGIGIHYARILLKQARENYKNEKNFIKFPFEEQLQNAFKMGFDKLFESVENELRANLSEIGEDDAIKTFQINLEKLLLTKPEYGKNILAIDPGYAAGCKIAFLDELGNPKDFTKIFLHKKIEAKKILEDFLKKYSPNVIIVGNGTGNKETVELLGEISNIPEIFIVNESGASVYSASKIAQEEFPDLDSLDRGTISLGRRFIDPLSELVKVPVGSIGVGLYQHDVPTKKLEEQLGNVVEDVVNEIGVNVNNASSYVLNYISGIDKRLAKKIFSGRPYASRAELKKQMSDKVYEQAIGFLRIPESDEKLDNTDIHPEQYELAKYLTSSPALLLEEKGALKDFFVANKEEIQKLYPDANVETLEFILNSYQNAGIEKRTISTHKKANLGKNLAEIKEGDVVDGIVKNVVAFGAFVDIGLKNDGLVHISEISDTDFVKDPNDFLEVGQDVKVRVVSIDEKSGKVGLSMRV